MSPSPSYPKQFARLLAAGLFVLFAFVGNVSGQEAVEVAPEIHADSASTESHEPTPEDSHAAAGYGQDHAAADDHGDDHGPAPPIWLVIPFLTLLIMIATGPLFYAHHWHRHYPKYAIAFGLIVAGYYIFALKSPTPVLHAIQEYVAFIALVASLFIAASGIYLSINSKGAPLSNVVLLFVASLIANIIATTGAAMLFIRCFLGMNKGRLKPYHVVFFIFLVANVGGALTPIGDPPLFLGFLRGVPFFWTLENVWFIWLPTTAFLLLVFFIIDSRNKGEFPLRKEDQPLIHFQGGKSVIWIVIIVLSVFLDPNVLSWVPPLDFGNVHLPFGIREIIMLSVAFLAYKTADPVCLTKNDFNFEPIREVGWLFLGIFATMQPALATIAIWAEGNADSLSTGMFYWGTGILSAILDNAPTYLNFVSAAMGKFGLDVNVTAEVVQFSQDVSAGGSGFYLQAISVAAVFFGAMTYIGNAPNFMVKAIAEGNGVDTPSFMGYLVKYSIPILLPTYLLVYIIFFSGWVL